MATESTCGAVLDCDPGPDLVCVLPAGHFGPVHEDADGVRWGDVELPLPPVE